MFKHIVLQRFNDKSDARKAAEMLSELPGKIPELLYMEVAVNELSTERSYDMALIAIFNDIEGYHAYEKHPAHLEVRSFIKPRRNASACVDFNY